MAKVKSDVKNTALAATGAAFSISRMLSRTVDCLGISNKKQSRSAKPICS